jgi:predicted CxxxxCH...CXXCH cytochrome family protein
VGRHLPVVFSIVVLAQFGAACGVARSPSKASAVADDRCVRCHGGTDNQTGAPPVTLTGQTDASLRGVGAHTRHVSSGTLAAPLGCGACHLDPRQDAHLHMDGKVEVVFGSLAMTGGVTPSWNGTTCATSYCHGAFVGGNASNAPAWTAPKADACGTCHALPPAAPHPPSTDCGKCHPGYTSTSVNPATHVNGAVDVAGLTCTTCHGDPTRSATTLNPQLPAAPPLGTRGETATTDRAVGAHQRHLEAGDAGNGVACTECHQVPTSVTHATGTVALTFGPLATAGGTTPSWNGTSCTTSYCHGAFAGGNASNAPTWTAQKANACGTCHTLPPAAPHPNSTDCGKCHPGYTSSSVNPALHINGTIDVAGLTCTSCHGDSTRLATTLNPQLPVAPPVGTQGETATTTRAVGAHQRHLGPSATSGGVACTECHQVPTSVTHATGTVVLTFGPLATAGGTTPSWNGTTCTASYCHGAFAGGNASNAPTWTAPHADACGTCHGNPAQTPSALPVGHAALAAGSTNATCNVCHPDTVDATGAIVIASGKHLDGQVETDPAAKHPVGWLDTTSPDFHGLAAAAGALACLRCHAASPPATVTAITCADCHGGSGGSIACNTCHGSAANAAPPKDTTGHTATSALGVGAHQSHVTAAHQLTAPLDCVFCHVKPVNLLDPGHLDGVVTVTAYTGASLQLAAVMKDPTFSASSATCATAYCHGATLVGGTATAPVWTQVDGTQATCTSCHGFPPPTGRPASLSAGGAVFTTHTLHAAGGIGYGCGACHPGYGTVTPSANVATHLDGTVEVGNLVTSWNPATGVCVGCHALCSATPGGPENVPCVWR